VKHFFQKSLTNKGFYIFGILHSRFVGKVNKIHVCSSYTYKRFKRSAQRTKSLMTFQGRNDSSQNEPHFKKVFDLEVGWAWFFWARVGLGLKPLGSGF
jgi:hypothetical protein